MEWVESTLFVGCKIAYYLQDTESCSIIKTALTKCVKSNQYLMAVSLSSRPEVLLCDSDNVLAMVDKQGVPTRAVSAVQPRSRVGGGADQRDDAAHAAGGAVPLPVRDRQELPLRLQSHLPRAHPGESFTSRRADA